jgi:hypothetical protein
MSVGFIVNEVHSSYARPILSTIGLYALRVRQNGMNAGPRSSFFLLL